MRSKHFFSDSGHVAYQIKGQVGHVYTMVINTMGGLCGKVFFNLVGDACIAQQYDITLFYFISILILVDFRCSHLQPRPAML